ncbi:RNA polymerase sigma factor [Fictibacillus barbaricus]|nr:sigma-70 family RNA polymerase sigma factor [Fictibacillus barbaricus]
MIKLFYISETVKICIQKTILSRMNCGERGIFISNLVEQAQKGNEIAFSELIKKHERLLFNVAYRYVRNKEDAEDIVQETAYRAFCYLHTLNEPHHFKVWIKKITVYVSIEFIRAKKYTVPLDNQKLEFIKKVDSNLAVSLDLNDLFMNISEEERNLILLKYYYGYSLKEIAEILNISVANVKVRLYRSKKYLKGR